MGNSIKLTPVQKELREKLYTINQKLWEFINKRETMSNYDEVHALYDEMAKIAHELHMSLKDSGYEPKHHKVHVLHHS